MQNKDIREEIRIAGLRHWQIVDQLKITDSVFSKKLRYELSDSEKQEIRNIISKLKN